LKSQASSSKLPASDNFIGKYVMSGTKGLYVPIPQGGFVYTDVILNREGG
jgi:hypothetical protein